MEKNSCFNCTNAFCFQNGTCRCFLEPSDKNEHPENYHCLNHNPVDERGLRNRIEWKEYQKHVVL